MDRLMRGARILIREIYLSSDLIFPRLNQMAAAVKRQNGENNMRLLLALSLTCSVVIQLSPAAMSQAIFTGPPAASSSPPSYSPPPVVQVDPGPRIPIIPVIPVIPVRPDPPKTFSNPFMPLDVIQPLDTVQAPKLQETPDAMKGISNETSMAIPNVQDNADGILVRATEGTQYEKEGSCAVHLSKGSILVSVRRPSKVALVTTHLGQASFSADSDVEVRCQDGSMRIINMSGLHQSVRVKIANSVLPGDAEKIVSIAPGYEMVLGDHKLHRAELHPTDGYSRRAFKTLDNGFAAISEISVESVLNCSELIATLNQTQSDKRERRILADMSKMAAVLNYMNGANGYQSQPKASLNVNSEIHE